MATQPLRHNRNLFEVDNARNLSAQELVDTFIPTQSFWRLLSAKHHVLLGARGHGKTALARMLTHDHLTMLAKRREEPRAWSAVRDQEFIGTYLPTRLEWVGGLKNKPWLDEREREELFQWRLNIASCMAFVTTAKSCLSLYAEGEAKQAQAERELARQLSADWSGGGDVAFSDLVQLREWLEDTDYYEQIRVLRERAAGHPHVGPPPEGVAFGTDLFVPLRQGIRRLSRLLQIQNGCTWLLCLDEAEYLEEADHRIINSHMRAFPDNLFFKLTTMPYCHHTLATNIGAALVPGQDFDYINMDSDGVLQAKASGDAAHIGTEFGQLLFSRLVKASGLTSRFSRMRAKNIFATLGESPLLDPRQEDWDADSSNMQLLEKYASRDTVERARRLAGSGAFKENISRKVNGALLLRKEVDEWRGNRAFTAYSGARMAIRCSDGIPRHMMKIFNALLVLSPRRIMRGNAANVSPEDQTRIMRMISASRLNQVRSYPRIGPELHEFLCMLGEYMRCTLHERPLTTDQITSVIIDNSISDADWRLVRVAVGEGFLYPNLSTGNPDEMPWREGIFHLAYSFAPHFLLLPRRGKAAKLSTFSGFWATAGRQYRSSKKSQPEHPRLFEEGSTE